MKLLATVLLVAATSIATPAFADAPGAPAAAPVADPGPHPTGLQVGLRFPWDVTITPNVVGIGMMGLGLDLGERVTDRLYLGVATEDEMIMNISSATASGLDNRFRAGVEARYIFHTGTSMVGGGSSGDCCCYSEPVEVPRYDWVGLRFGEESLGDFATRGTFADVSIGTDAQMGSGQLGAYVSAGISSEPASAYAATTPADLARTVVTPDSPGVTSYYFTLGMHVSFGG